MSDQMTPPQAEAHDDGDAPAVGQEDRSAGPARGCRCADHARGGDEPLGKAEVLARVTDVVDALTEDHGPENQGYCLDFFGGDEGEERRIEAIVRGKYSSPAKNFSTETRDIVCPWILRDMPCGQDDHVPLIIGPWRAADRDAGAGVVDSPDASSTDRGDLGHGTRDEEGQG